MWPQIIALSILYRFTSTGAERLDPEECGPSGRGSQSRPKRAQITPEWEREDALQRVSKFMSATPAATTQAVRVDMRKPATPEPVKSVPPADPAFIRRKVISIIDELVNNSDFKVCMSGIIVWHCWLAGQL